ncbi:tRNA (adenosine(37)-N6)-threonylcarbamoyltransferase complex transferase subunit TsaD [Alienimonas chondri]|uniref:tRNA N6-adenosine threonylcarbamoyltransferase n=1 Tax=Alienimonas chondri TaxID=2681879 RepID=A0ABX1VHS6_9PLAN|nr:tRNA (adenosine(37)-N6)-threonylcarbamoyltransferase complex transferase subunit TsaD [Alienimonas chondri]NNJ27050.1 tRNA N6-adenosine threonylcarbamoyltransferase [Alienimonas chondri]
MDSSKPILAIESSCDETAAAVIAADRSVLSSVVSTQAALHERFGGVVPEIASRAHVERILPVLKEAMDEAGVTGADLSAIAVVTHPGLVGSLLVGVTAAKTLAAVWGLPLVAVDHLRAHLYACRLAFGEDIFPACGLVVSGGHTNWYDCPDPVRSKLIGSTIDDAAGEAFDKVARLLGLPYPGGPSVQQAAMKGDPEAVPLPRPMMNRPDLAVSFSGLKTAVRYAALGNPNSPEAPVPPLDEGRIADLAASFQAAAVDVIVGKCEVALKQTGRPTLLVGGGVAANRALREGLTELCNRRQVRLCIAPMEYCVDNAAMAGLAWEIVERGEFAPLDCDVTPGLVRA